MCEYCDGKFHHLPIMIDYPLPYDNKWGIRVIDFDKKIQIIVKDIAINYCPMCGRKL